MRVKIFVPSLFMKLNGSKMPSKGALSHVTINMNNWLCTSRRFYFWCQFAFLRIIVQCIYTAAKWVTCECFWQIFPKLKGWICAFLRSDFVRFVSCLLNHWYFSCGLWLLNKFLSPSCECLFKSLVYKYTCILNVVLRRENLMILFFSF